MEPRRKSDTRNSSDVRTGVETEGPSIQQQDWDALEGAPVLPDSVPENGDIRYDVETDGELPEEDDDNPDGESDEALPDDEEEQAIKRDLSGLGERYEPE